MFQTLCSFMFFFIILLQPAAAQGELPALVSTMTDQEVIGLTIYSNNLALVKDRRRLTLPSGISRLAFSGVSGEIRPETAIMRSISHDGGLTVIEQNFDFDLLTPQKLLEEFTGRQIGVVKTHPTTGEEKVEEATVLSTNNGVVLRIGDRIETGDVGRFIFPNVPAGLHDRPTLTMTLHSDIEQMQTVELSYLTGGLSWKADYVAELENDESHFALKGWVTLTNSSGTDFNHALLQLVAGNVHQALDYPIRRPTLRAAEAVTTAAPEMAEESLFEYHLYTLERPATITDKQTKQIALLQASEVEAAKEFVLKGQESFYRSRQPMAEEKLPAIVFLNFPNSTANNLGMPLPGGIVRVYKKDSENRIQFVGEDRIDHTPENETLRLRLGQAFDVTATRKQTDFQKVAGFSRYNYVLESGHQIQLHNGKEKEVIVKVVEPLPGDWEILSENRKHVKETATTAAWQIAVPAKSEAELTYRVRVKY
jgi:hypothetical protein